MAVKLMEDVAWLGEKGTIVTLTTQEELGLVRSGIAEPTFYPDTEDEKLRDPDTLRKACKWKRR